MKKYISIALCAFSLTLAGCASTPKNQTEGDSSSESTGSSIPSHEHTYSDSWSNDDTYHWHPATCEHKDLVKDKTTHTYGSWTIDKQATEYETGSRHRICAVCDYRVDDTIAKLDHTHKAGDPVKENEVAPTCEGYGSYDTVVYCTECNAEISRVNETISPLGHDYGEWAVKTPAKCQEDGTEERVCSRDPSHKETRKIEAIGHKWGEATYEWSGDYSSCTAKRVCENDPSHIDSEKVTSTSTVTKQPTYSEEGLIKYSAVFKSEAFAKQEYDLVTEKRSMLSYKLSTDGTYYTVKMDSSSIFGDIVVPSTYNNLPVKEVDCLGFYGCTKITSVTLPSSITKIGHSAFQLCSSLTSVTLNEGLTEIGYEAFMSCAKLEAIEVPSTVTKIGYNAFYRCTGLKEATLKDGLVEIGSCAFYNCSSLASIHIPDTVTSLGTSALKECSALKEVYIGKKVASLESGMLYNCNALESLTLPYVGESVSEDGYLADFFTISTTSQSYLYNFTPSTLKSVTVLDTCVSLSNHAFDGCDNIESLSLPFIGGSASENQFLGYIYGGATYEDNATAVPTSLKKVTIQDGCEEIANHAFDGCATLEEVNIGENVGYIGFYAFNGCNSIESLVIPASATSFNNSVFCNMESLLSITFLGDDFELGGSMFSGSTKLQIIKVNDTNLNYSVSDSILYNKDKTKLICCPAGLSGTITVPEGVTEIDEYAFSGCDKVTEIKLPSTIVALGKSAFAACASLAQVNIPAGISSIEPYTFLSCSSLTSIDLPDTVSTIGKYAFARCSSLASLDIPQKVSDLPDAVFYECTALKTVVVPDGVKTVGKSAFQSCSSLETLDLPDSIEEVGEVAFCYCTSLTKFDVPENLSSLPKGALCYCTSLKTVIFSSGFKELGLGVFLGCSSIETISLPNSVASIGQAAFENCTSLKSFEMPYEVVDLSRELFWGCSSLETVELSIRDIGSVGYASFYNCTSLKEIALYGVATIGDYAFRGCTAMTGIGFADNLKSIGNYALYGCSALTTVVFGGTIAQWGNVTKGSYWRSGVYATTIQCSDGTGVLGS